MSMHPKKNIEFEVRLGKLQGGKFNPDTPLGEFDRLLRKTHEAAGITLPVSCAVSIDDHYYVEPVSGRQVRQRTTFYSTVASPQSEAIHKKRLWVDTTAWARISVAEEEPVAVHELPLALPTERVALHQRCSVSIPLIADDATRRAHDSLKVRVDFSNVWVGKTETEAARRQQTDMPVKNVEFELENFTAKSEWLQPGMMRERAVQIANTIKQVLVG
jgi:hypothetical protein